MFSHPLPLCIQVVTVSNFRPQYDLLRIVQRLLPVEIFQPVIHVAKRAQQVQPCLCKVESCFASVFHLLPLIDAGHLFRPGLACGCDPGPAPEPFPTSNWAITVFS